MEFLTNIIGQRLTVSLRGRLDKDFKVSPELMELLKNNKEITEIIFVLRKIEDVVHEAVNLWISEMQMLSDKGYDLTFIECPKILVDPLIQKGKTFNLKSLCSFVVPYYCDHCNEEYPQLINTSSLSLSFASYSKPICPNCGKHLSLDITEDELERIACLLPATDLYSDKRKYPRFDVSGYNIKAVISYSGVRHECKVVNFSEVGVALSGEKSIEVGTPVNIELTGRNGEKIISAGSVVWLSVNEPPYILIGVSLESRDIFKALIKR